MYTLKYGKPRRSQQQDQNQKAALLLGTASEEEGILEDRSQKGFERENKDVESEGPSRVSVVIIGLEAETF